jgi:hypothetical protein
MSYQPDDDAEVEYHSRETAIELAKAEALRSYEEKENAIRYVAYVDEFYDYCLCEFVQEPEGWLKTYRALTVAERLPSEEIGDDLIRRLTEAGNMLAAIRLYRTKYEVGLKEAFDALRNSH